MFVEKVSVVEVLLLSVPLDFIVLMWTFSANDEKEDFYYVIFLHALDMGVFNLRNCRERFKT